MCMEPLYCITRQSTSHRSQNQPYFWSYFRWLVQGRGMKTVLLIAHVIRPHRPVAERASRSARRHDATNMLRQLLGLGTREIDAEGEFRVFLREVFTVTLDENQGSCPQGGAIHRLIVANLHVADGKLDIRLFGKVSGGVR